MGYTKPGVEVTQEQRSNTPVLTTPELEACIVGHSYYWLDPASESAIVSGTVTGGTEFVYTVSGHSDYFDIKGDEQLVVVDLLGISGDAIGSIKHLVYGTDYTVNSANGTQITIKAGATTASNTYQARIGYRAKNTALSAGVKVLTSSTDIEDTLGKIVSWNPVAYGAQIAMSNASASIKALGVAIPSTGTVGDTDVINAINNYLPMEEVAVFSAMTQKVTASDLKAHCDTYSAATEKKERVAFCNPTVGYTENPKDAGFTNTEKVEKAVAIRDANALINARRVFSIHPDAGYVAETRHIATLNPAFIAASFAGTIGATFSFSTYNLYAKFAADVTLKGVKYKAGQNIDSAVFNAILNSGWGGATGNVTVLAPVPGYYYCAQSVGQYIGTPVSQPLTNVPGSGITETFGSQDVFSETQLNKMAEGGTWIMTQDSPSGPVYSRHQMSTDVTSVAKREMSITKALDFTSKFIRKSLKPYIGRYNITPSFLKLVGTVLNGVARYLAREGYIEDMKVNSIKQDDISPDTIYVEIEVKVLYPVNYIKVILAF